jgi:hypothetical protein
MFNCNLLLLLGISKVLSKASPTFFHSWIGFILDFRGSLLFHNSSCIVCFLSYSSFCMSIEGFWVCVRRSYFSLESIIFLLTSDISTWLCFNFNLNFIPYHRSSNPLMLARLTRGLKCSSLILCSFLQEIFPRFSGIFVVRFEAPFPLVFFFLPIRVWRRIFQYGSILNYVPHSVVYGKFVNL